MTKKIIIGILALTFLGMIVAMAKNNNQQPVASVVNKIESRDTKNSVDKLEVYYFHRTQRCYSCSTISRYLRETMEQKFSQEIKNETIDFREINVDLPENKEIAVKFQASGSSLFVNAISDGQDNVSQDTNIWRLLNDEIKFKSYIENKINLFLGK